MTSDSAPSPSAAHITCLSRKWYASWYFCWAIMADALYTITTPANTSSTVVTNSTLSDLSFLAIFDPAVLVAGP